MHTKEFCFIKGLYPGNIFHFFLTPMLGESKGGTSYFRLQLPIRVDSQTTTTKTVSKSETRIGIQITYYGLIMSVAFDFEPGDYLDFKVGKSEVFIDVQTAHHGLNSIQKTCRSFKSYKPQK